MRRASCSLDHIQFGKETCLINSKTQIFLIYFLRFSFFVEYKVGYILWQVHTSPKVAIFKHALSQSRCTYVCMYMINEKKIVINACFV